MWFIKLILFALLAFAGYWLFSHTKAPQSPLPASSPLMSIPNVEQEYYLKIFDYAMDTLPAGGTYPWGSYSASGNISATAKYTSKWKATCRPYIESIAVNVTQTTADGKTATTAQTATDDGIACKRQGTAGWCHLKTTDAQTCAMEPPAGIVDSLHRSVSEGMESGKGIIGKAQGWWR